MALTLWPSRRILRFVAPTALIFLLLHLFSLSNPPVFLDNDKLPPQRQPQNGRKKAFFKSTFDWASHTPRYPVSSLIPLPTGNPRPLRRVQHVFDDEPPRDRIRLDKQREQVRRAFVRCWKSYKQYAWMRDELAPISAGSKDTFGGWAATLIDALDTLWIMGLREEFDEAVKAVATIDWAKTSSRSCNVFETTIRHLGGLLAAYDLSGEDVLLAKAVELGDMLYAAFDTPNRTPPFWLDFENAKSGNLVADANIASASPCSLSLEFTRLAQLTGEAKYYDAIARITNLLVKHQNSTKLPGMWPVFFNLRDEIFDQGTSFTLGASADSLYEYFPKEYALLNGLEPVYEQLYRTSMETAERELLFRPMLPDNADVLFSSTTHVSQGSAKLSPQVEHLGCFAGGMFALGGRLFGLEDHVKTGVKLAKGCMYAYKAFPCGIMPEIFNMIPCESRDECSWDEQKWKAASSTLLPEGFRSSRDMSYLLRPEAIESVFLLYRMTGDVEYLDTAWEMFTAIQKVTRTSYGNAAISDVTTEYPQQIDSMESFWLSETLKYFYLIFSPPDLISLDSFVFNTEAHPLRRPE